MGGVAVPNSKAAGRVGRSGACTGALKTRQSSGGGRRGWEGRGEWGGAGAAKGGLGHALEPLKTLHSNSKAAGGVGGSGACTGALKTRQSDSKAAEGVGGGGKGGGSGGGRGSEGRARACTGALKNTPF